MKNTNRVIGQILNSLEHKEILELSINREVMPRLLALCDDNGNKFASFKAMIKFILLELIENKRVHKPNHVNRLVRYTISYLCMFTTLMA